jgi:DNA polymerase-3 subunit delta'
MALLEHARGRADTAAGEVKVRVEDDLELLPAKERKRAQREGDEQGRRVHRRAHDQALDQGLQLVGLWLRDVACVADGVEDLVHHTDRLDALREDAQRSDAHRLRSGIALVDDVRISLEVHPNEELALEGLAYRLARELRVN